MASKAPSISPNIKHACTESIVPFARFKQALSDTVYTDEEFKLIIDFFLFHAPVLKSDKTENLSGQRSLRYYGWTGNGNMTKLEKALIKSADALQLSIFKSDGIENALRDLELFDTGCIVHSRAALKQRFKIKVDEYGKIALISDETRLECLFRHIRNSLAHNNTYAFMNNRIMLEDMDTENSQICARLLIPKEALLSWIKIIKKEASI